MAKKPVMVRLDPELVTAIEARAAEHNLSVSAWVAKAAEAAIAQRKIEITYVTTVRI